METKELQPGTIGTIQSIFTSEDGLTIRIIEVISPKKVRAAVKTIYGTEQERIYTLRSNGLWAEVGFSSKFEYVKWSMSRGGKRPGAGRKALEGERHTITLRLPIDCIKILDRHREATGESRTNYITRLLRGAEK